MNIDTFSNQIDYFILVYANQRIDTKKFNARKHYVAKDIIKHYNMIITGKILCDQAIDYDIKLFKEIRKLTTIQGEVYITGCLLDYDYIKIIIY